LEAWPSARFCLLALKSLLFNRQEFCEVDCEWREGNTMAEKLADGDLVAKIPINSKLTAQEVEEALDIFPVGPDHDVAN
jgi:hypothetical protein